MFLHKSRRCSSLPSPPNIVILMDNSTPHSMKIVLFVFNVFLSFFLLATELTKNVFGFVASGCEQQINCREITATSNQRQVVREFLCVKLHDELV